MRSTPEANGATSDEARASSRGTLAPNWTMVGGWGVEMVKSKGGEWEVEGGRGGGQRTAVPRELVAVELFGEDHGGPAEVGAVFVDGFAEGELGGC